MPEAPHLSQICASQAFYVLYLTDLLAFHPQQTMRTKSLPLCEWLFLDPHVSNRYGAMNMDIKKETNPFWISLNG